jgi:hypothetical protein
VFALVLIGALSYFVYVSKANDTTPTNTAASTPTTSLLTYTNPTYGYSLQYPNTWTYQQNQALDASATTAEKNAVIAFSDGTSTRLSVRTDVKTKFSGLTLAQYAQQFVAQDKGTLTNTGTYTVGQTVGYTEKVVYTDPSLKGGILYFTQNDTDFFAFITNEAVASQEIANVLKSFKLTAVTATDPTATWKVYTNSIFGFTFKYPSNYTLTDNLQKSAAATTTASNKLSLKDDTAIGKPMLEIYVDPAGFGGAPTNTVYGLKLNTDKTLIVTAKTSANVKAGDLGYDATRQILGTNLGGVKLGANTYIIRFSYDTGKSDRAGDFDQILTTFKLTK